MSGAPITHLVGVLRGDPVTKKWTALDDAGHQPFGIESVEVVGNVVRVHFDITLAKVGKFDALPDETYVINGINTGASGGLAYADIRIAKDGVAMTPAAACIAGSNIWVEGKGYLS